MEKHLTLRELLPELNAAQFTYLFNIVNECCSLSLEQRDKLETLLGFRINI